MQKIAVFIDDINDLLSLNESFIGLSNKDKVRSFLRDFYGSSEELMNYILGYYGKKDVVDIDDFLDMFTDNEKLRGMVDFFKSEDLMNPDY